MVVVYNTFIKRVTYLALHFRRNHTQKSIKSFKHKLMLQDPIDAHYERLNTDISVLEKDTDEFKVRIAVR